MNVEEVADDIGRLMKAFRAGDRQAAKDLVNLLYPELRKLAAAQMRRERTPHSWQPTALVNEFYLELIKIKFLKPGEDPAEEKQDFMRLAAHLMKRLLIHHSRPLYKRIEKVTLDDDAEPRVTGEEELVEIDVTLNRLKALNPRLRALVELRVFEGLTGEQIAERLGCGPATVARDWSFAKRWLQEELRP